MKPNLSIKITETNEDKGYQIINFNGEFDKAGQTEIKDDLEKIVESFAGKSLVFNFENLKFINSEGIGYLMEIHTHLVQRGRKLVIVGVSARIADVFQAIGIHEIVPVYPSLDDFLKK